jgi:DNA-binding transcriptional regulator GbsR (MarR family)
MESIVENSLQNSRENFIQGLSRIAHFWGFPKAMGAIFGAVYLSSEAMTLDKIVEQVGVSKGAVSTNIRNLERLGIVHKQIKLGDRKDYYTAESDFWKVVKEILREREKNEFDLAIRSVGESIALLENDTLEEADAETAAFYKERMLALKKFFDSLDNLVTMFLAVDDLRGNFIKKKFLKNK